MTPPTAALMRPGRRDGFIIIAVLWIVVALASLAATYATFVGNAVGSVAINDDRLRSETLMTAAVELAAYRMTLTPNAAPVSSGTFRFRLGGAEVLVRYTPESARIDLNAAQKPLLAGMFRALGAEPEAAGSFADRIIAWRSPQRGNADSEETSRYRAAGLGYGPRQGPFAHADELWLVAGIPDSLKRQAFNLVTVYSGQPNVDIAEAVPAVIAALPGITPDRLDALLRQRARTGDTLPGIRDTRTGRTRRIAIDIGFDNGRKSGGEVVVLMAEIGDVPYRILSWQNDFDRPRAGGSSQRAGR